MLPFSVNAMQIDVKLPTDQNITIEVESSDTIEAVKEKIYAQQGISTVKQILMFNGTELEDGRTLGEYNIQVGNVIDLKLIDVQEKIEVILDANGGSFENSYKYIIEEWDNSYYDTLVKPTREGYTFKGYYTEKTGGTKFEMILNESGIDRNMTFYAQWEEDKIVPPTMPQEENPNTFDDIGNSIIIGIVSLIGLIGTIIYLKKQNKARI